MVDEAVLKAVAAAVDPDELIGFARALIAAPSEMLVRSVRRSWSVPVSPESAS